MSSDPELLEGAAFTELTGKVYKNIFRLCNETYKATKKPPPEPDLRDLIARAEAQIAEHGALVEQYTGGRKDAMVSAGSQLKSLKKFTQALKKTLPRSDKTGAP